MFGKMFCAHDIEKCLGPQRMRNYWRRVRGLKGKGRGRGERRGCSTGNSCQSSIQVCRESARDGQRQGNQIWARMSLLPALRALAPQPLCPAHGLAQTLEAEACFPESQQSHPAPEAHLEVAHHGLEAPTLGPGDALQTAEDKARVALTAFHTPVRAGHAREPGMAGGGAHRGTQRVCAVGWAGHCWWRRKQRRAQGRMGKREGRCVFRAQRSKAPQLEASAQSWEAEGDWEKRDPRTQLLLWAQKAACWELPRGRSRGADRSKRLSSAAV